MFSESSKDSATGRAIDRLVQLWPLWILFASGIMGYFKLQYTVEDNKRNIERWQVGAETRREKSREEQEEQNTRITRVEKDIEWLKKSK